jgi:hypothetical protein
MGKLERKPLGVWIEGIGPSALLSSAAGERSGGRLRAARGGRERRFVGESARETLKGFDEPVEVVSVGWR